MQQRRLTLDNDAFRGRVRGYASRPVAASVVDAPHRRQGAPPRTSPTLKSVSPLRSMTAGQRSLDFVSPPRPRPAAPRAQQLHALNMQGPKRPARPTKPKTRKKQRLFTLALAAASIIIGVGLWAFTIRTNHQVVTQVKAMQVTAAANDASPTDSPTNAADYDESRPNMSQPYTVSPDLPKYLKIDKLDVMSRVKRMGVDNQNIVQTPKNIYDTGWFDGSAKPGETGAVFINGHVSGPTQRGVFYGLKNLKQGDPITIVKGDGTSLTYTVVASESFPADGVDMNKVLRPYGNALQGLNLMTCSGSFDRSTQEYKERRVIYAVREP